MVGLLHRLTGSEPMGLGPPARNCFMVAKDANFVRGTKSADRYKVTAPPEVGSLNR